MSEQPDTPEVPPESETSKALSLVQSNLAEFDTVEAGLQALEKKYANVVYDVTTTKGMDEAKKARAEIREPRYAVQHAVDNAKRPLETMKKAVARRGEQIIARIKPLEDNVHGQIKAQEDKIEADKAAEREREAARAAAIAKQIEGIQDAVVSAVNQPVEVIDAKLSAVEAVVVTLDTFGDRTGEAEQARAKAITTLKEMRVQREAFDVQQAELQRREEEQRKRDEKAERERLEQQQKDEQAAKERREAQEKEDRERQERLNQQEAELKARREQLDREENDARAKRQKQEDDERDERQRVEDEARAKRDREAEELRVNRAKWRNAIDAIKGLPPLCGTVAAIDDAVRRIGDVYMTEENFGEYLEEADAVMKEALRYLAEKRPEQLAREQAAEEARAKQQRQGEERERAEAADKRKRDACDTMLTALRAAHHMLTRDPIDDAKMKVINQVNEAIYEATGENEF